MKKKNINNIISVLLFDTISRVLVVENRLIFVTIDGVPLHAFMTLLLKNTVFLLL